MEVGAPELVISFAAVAAIMTFLVVMFALLIYSLVWVYKDAESRGKKGWLVALLVFLFNWPWSLLLWYVFRPEHRTPLAQTPFKA
jgi:hypothetical protein